MKANARCYGSGPGSDEGGPYHMKEVEFPRWYKQAVRHCAGCHFDFYNGRMNCTGNPFCFNLKQTFARRKTRPACWR